MLNNKLAKIFTVFCSALLIGCAVGRPSTPEDPFKSINKKTFAFNRQVDKIVYRPIAKIYDFVVPDIIQHRVTHFFNNLGEVGTISNDILQANLKLTMHDTARFFVNTTVGVLGLFDPATHIGLKRHTQDVGLTLAKWGVKDSPYFIIPFLGPSTLRDTVALPGNYALSIPTYIKPDKTRYALMALQKIDTRAQLLSTDKLLKQAFNPYVFLRDAYLQRRKNSINGAVSH